MFSSKIKTLSSMLVAKTFALKVITSNSLRTTFKLIKSEDIQTEHPRTHKHVRYP